MSWMSMVDMRKALQNKTKQYRFYMSEDVAKYLGGNVGPHPHMGAKLQKDIRAFGWAWVASTWKGLGGFLADQNAEWRATMLLAETGSLSEALPPCFLPVCLMRGPQYG